MDFCGYPLLAWSIAAARDCPDIGCVYVSTDSPDIMKVAEQYGAEGIERPVELAGDTASSESALIHACSILMNRGIRPERVVFLQATSPLRESSELTEALSRFDEDKLDSLFSASEPEDFLMWRETAAGLESLNYAVHDRKRRQESNTADRILIETGSFYITRLSLLMEEGNRLGGRIGYYPVPVWKSWEIDSEESFRLCETMMKIHGLDRQPPATIAGPSQRPYQSTGGR